MHYGRYSYTKIDLHSIKCRRRRHAIRWFASLWHSTPAWADQKKIKAIYDQAKAKRIAGQPVEVNHIVPRHHKLVCGLHVHYNLEIIPRALNQFLSNHTWPDMPNEPGQLFANPREPEQYALPLY